MTTDCSGQTQSHPLQETPRQARYQIITPESGESYVLDRRENILYPIKQPIYKLSQT
jgi:hypothetical protein